MTGNWDCLFIGLEGALHRYTGSNYSPQSHVSSRPEGTTQTLALARAFHVFTLGRHDTKSYTLVLQVKVIPVYKYSLLQSVKDEHLHIFRVPKVFIMPNSQLHKKIGYNVYSYWCINVVITFMLQLVQLELILTTLYLVNNDIRLHKTS